MFWDPEELDRRREEKRLRESGFIPVTPVARTEDPETSHLSAKDVTKDGTRKLQSSKVLEAVRKWPDRTASELAELSEIPHEAVHKRLSELADTKNGGPFIERKNDEVGLVKRRCSVTGKMALTWVPVWP